MRAALSRVTRCRVHVAVCFARVAPGSDRGMGEESVTITAYQDGPYLVRGPFTILDQEGREIPTQRRTIALCRCGKSRLRPLCDGTHRAIGFRAASGAESQASPEPLLEPAPAGDSPGARRPASGGQRRPAQIGPIARIEPTAHVNGSGPRSGDLMALLEIVRDAERCLVHSLTPPCRAGDYAAMSLAAPLLTAARRLLEWGCIDAGPRVPPGRSNGHGPAPVGRSSSRAQITRALELVRRMEPHEDPRLHQVRSLLTDANKALAS